MTTEIIVIKQVKKFPIYDIFQGEGWENWSRILIKNGRAILIGGNVLSIVLLKLVIKNIAKTYQQQQKESFNNAQPS